MYISSVSVRNQPALPGDSVELDYTVKTLNEPITHFLVYLSCESPSSCPLGPKINIHLPDMIPPETVVTEPIYFNVSDVSPGRYNLSLTASGIISSGDTATSTVTVPFEVGSANQLVSTSQDASPATYAIAVVVGLAGAGFVGCLLAYRRLRSKTESRQVRRRNLRRSQ